MGELWLLSDCEEGRSLRAGGSPTGLGSVAGAGEGDRVALVGGERRGSVASSAQTAPACPSSESGDT